MWPGFESLLSALVPEVDSLVIDLRREPSGIMAEDLQPTGSAPRSPSTVVTIFRADTQELNGSGQEIARFCGALAARDEERGHLIAEAERAAPPGGSLGLPPGMRIDPRTTKLRASLRAEYERSGHPPLNSVFDAAPLVSVVIPCYNYGYYLEDAILSATMACSHPMEILVVDDGSTDEGSLGAVEDLAGRYHFRLLRQTHTGQNGARYKGFRYSRGKFIQFLDADDLLAPGKIDLQVEMMTGGRGIDIAVCEYELCDAEGQGRRLIEPSTLAGFAFTADDFLIRWERGFSLPIHCALFRREVLDPSQFPCITKTGKEDWIFWIVVASKSPRFHFHPEVLAIYRIHGHNTFANREGMGIDFLRACMYLLQAGHNSCDSFLEESIDHFRNAYLGPIKYEAEIHVAQAASQAAHYKNLVDELRQKHTDVETRLAQATSQAAHYKNLVDELQQKYIDAETRLVQAASQAAHYRNILEEQQQQRADAETRLAQAASQAAHYRNILEEQQQQRADAETRLAQAASQAAHYRNLLEEQQQRQAHVETRLVRAASQATDYRNLLEEQQQRRADAETQLARAASQAADYKILLEEQRQRLVDLDSLRASYHSALSEGTAFRQSLSWRITAPLRYLGSVLRFR